MKSPHEVGILRADFGSCRSPFPCLWHGARHCAWLTGMPQITAGCLTVACCWVGFGREKKKMGIFFLCHMQWTIWGTISRWESEGGRTVLVLLACWEETLCDALVAVRDSWTFRNQRIGSPGCAVSWEFPSATAMSWKHLPELCFYTHLSNFAVPSPSSLVLLQTEELTAVLRSTFNKETILPFHCKGLFKGMRLQQMPSLRKGSSLRFKLHLTSAWLQTTLGLILFLLWAWLNKFHTFGRKSLACFHRTRQGMIFELKTCLHTHVALRALVPPKLTQKWEKKT